MNINDVPGQTESTAACPEHHDGMPARSSPVADEVHVAGKDYCLSDPGGLEVSAGLGGPAGRGCKGLLGQPHRAPERKGEKAFCHWN